ncbi:MAG: hypothetical protein AAFN74_27250 [Myxococcota bacterium]
MSVEPETNDSRLTGPSVNPIGIVSYPEDYTAAPRAYGAWMRTTATAVLIVFAIVVTVTTGVSLGAYCLTSDGGNTRVLFDDVPQ